MSLLCSDKSDSSSTTRVGVFLDKDIKTLLLILLLNRLSLGTITNIYEDTIINKGVYGVVDVHNDAILDITGKNIYLTGLRALDNSTINFSGGNTLFLTAFVNSRVNIYSGNIDTIDTVGTNAVHIFGKDFIYNQRHESYGVLTFLWEDDTLESLYLRGCKPYYYGTYPLYTDSVVLHEVPELATIVLFFIGFIIGFIIFPGYKKIKTYLC